MLSSVTTSDGTVVIADLEAGIGTLTRLGDRGVDSVLIVVEPTAKSLDVGRRVAQLVRDKAIARTVVVANRLGGDADLRRVRAAFPDTEIRAVPDDPAVTTAERAGLAPLDFAPGSPAVTALVDLAERLV